MPKPKRLNHATAELTVTPPDELPQSQTIARIVAAEGKSLYTVALPSQKTILTELAPQFRNNIWLKKGGYVLVDLEALSGRENKLAGEIVNVVRDEKSWRKKSWWPTEFPKQNSLEDESDEDSKVGKMPSSESEDD